MKLSSIIFWSVFHLPGTNDPLGTRRLLLQLIQVGFPYWRLVFLGIGGHGGTGQTGVAGCCHLGTVRLRSLSPGAGGVAAALGRPLAARAAPSPWQSPGDAREAPASGLCLHFLLHQMTRCCRCYLFVLAVPLGAWARSAAGVGVAGSQRGPGGPAGGWDRRSRRPRGPLHGPAPCARLEPERPAAPGTGSRDPASAAALRAVRAKAGETDRQRPPPSPSSPTRLARAHKGRRGTPALRAESASPA